MPIDWSELVERLQDRYSTASELVEALDLDLLDFIEDYQDTIINKAKELDIL